MAEKDKEFLDAVAGRLRRSCEVKRLKPKDIHELTGIPLRSVHNYWAGEQAPGAEQLGKLKAGLGVNVNWLLTGDGPMFLGVATSEDRATHALESSKVRQMERHVSRLRALEAAVPRLAEKQQKVLSAELVRSVVDFGFMYDLDEEGIKKLLTFFDYCDECKQQ